MPDQPRPLIPVLDRVRNSRTEANMTMLADALGYSLAVTDAVATSLVTASRLAEDWVMAFSDSTDPETLADVVAERESIAERLDAVIADLRVALDGWQAAVNGGGASRHAAG